jgi:hypothetical protein
MLIKSSNDTTGNRTRDLPACSAVRSERFRHCTRGLRRLPASMTVSCPDFYTFINSSHSVVIVMVTCSALFCHLIYLCCGFFLLYDRHCDYNSLDRGFYVYAVICCKCQCQLLNATSFFSSLCLMVQVIQNLFCDTIFFKRHNIFDR